MQEVCVREVEQLRDLLAEKGLDYAVALGSVRGGNYPGCGPIPGEANARYLPGGGPTWGLSGAFGQAILVRDSIELVAGSSENVALARPFSGEGQDDEERGYMAVTITRPGAGSVRVYNAHLATRGDNRKAQVDQIVEAARAHPSAVIVGDLNTNETEIGTVLGSLSREGFRATDVLQTSPNDWQKKDSLPLRKLDWVWTRGLTAVEGSPRTFWVKSSDHRPLRVELR